MVSLINKQLLLTAYAYLFIMGQQKAQQGSEALQLQMEKAGSLEAEKAEFKEQMKAVIKKREKPRARSLPNKPAVPLLRKTTVKRLQEQVGTIAVDFLLPEEETLLSSIDGVPQLRASFEGLSNLTGAAEFFGAVKKFQADKNGSWKPPTRVGTDPRWNPARYNNGAAYTIPPGQYEAVKTFLDDKERALRIAAELAKTRGDNNLLEVDGDIYFASYDELLGASKSRDLGDFVHKVEKYLEGSAKDCVLKCGRVDGGYTFGYIRADRDWSVSEQIDDWWKRVEEVVRQLAPGESDLLTACAPLAARRIKTRDSDGPLDPPAEYRVQLLYGLPVSGWVNDGSDVIWDPSKSYSSPHVYAEGRTPDLRFEPVAELVSFREEADGNITHSSIQWEQAGQSGLEGIEKKENSWTGFKMENESNSDLKKYCLHAIAAATNFSRTLAREMKTVATRMDFFLSLTPVGSEKFKCKAHFNEVTVRSGLEVLVKDNLEGKYRPGIPFMHEMLEKGFAAVIRAARKESKRAASAKSKDTQTLIDAPKTKRRVASAKSKDAKKLIDVVFRAAGKNPARCVGALQSRIDATLAVMVKKVKEACGPEVKLISNSSEIQDHSAEDGQKKLSEVLGSDASGMHVVIVVMPRPAAKTEQQMICHQVGGGLEDREEESATTIVSSRALTIQGANCAKKSCN